MSSSNHLVSKLRNLPIITAAATAINENPLPQSSDSSISN
ncbi:unnamed protein product [Amaranthus hypochondriacus]